jgi:proteic killer suppression protein
VIRSFRDKETQAVFEGRHSRRFHKIVYAAEKKLARLDAAVELADLNRFPGKRLEALQGDRAGQDSIRVNDRFRLCFIWKDHDAFSVEMVDYH